MMSTQYKKLPRNRDGNFFDIRAHAYIKNNVNHIVILNKAKCSEGSYVIRVRQR